MSTTKRVRVALQGPASGRAFTLLEVNSNAVGMLSLAVGGLLVDAVAIEPVLRLGGTSLALTHVG